MTYQGRELATFSLDELRAILTHMDGLLEAREKARTNPKFEKMDFPPPNPEFINMKNAIVEEIGKRENA